MTKAQIEERDLLFCECLFETGSLRGACAELDIPLRTGRRIEARNRDKIVDMVKTELASLSYKAVKTVSASMDDDGTIPKGELRLKGATEILDRIGVSKAITTELEVKLETPIILLPAKDKVTVDPQYMISTEADNT